MPSRRERRLERTRGQILTVAAELVRAEGFDKVSLRQVAKAADYSPAALYEYFDSKEALLTALAEEASARLGRRLRDAARRTLDEPIVAVGLAYVRYARDAPEDFLLMFSRASGPVGTGPGSALEVMREVVDEALDAGRITLGALADRAQLAYALWAVAHGLAMLQHTSLADSRADFEAADSAALRTFVAGLRPAS